MIMDHEINSPGNVKNVVDGFNATDKHFLKGKMELLGKLTINGTSNTRIIPSV